MNDLDKINAKDIRSLPHKESLIEDSTLAAKSEKQAIAEHDEKIADSKKQRELKEKFGKRFYIIGCWSVGIFLLISLALFGRAVSDNTYEIPYVAYGILSTATTINIFVLLKIIATNLFPTQPR